MTGYGSGSPIWAVWTQAVCATKVWLLIRVIKIATPLHYYVIYDLYTNWLLIHAARHLVYDITMISS